MSGFACRIALSCSKHALFRSKIVTVSPALVRSVVSKPKLKDVVFVLGAPGSGKGTVCEDVVKVRTNFQQLLSEMLLFQLIFIFSHCAAKCIT